MKKRSYFIKTITLWGASMDRHQLKVCQKEPDLYDHDELLQHIEDESTTELYEHRAVGPSITRLIYYRIGTEKISDYLQRWFDKGDFYDYDIPEEWIAESLLTVKEEWGKALT